MTNLNEPFVIDDNVSAMDNRVKSEDEVRATEEAVLAEWGIVNTDDRGNAINQLQTYFVLNGTSDSQFDNVHSIPILGVQRLTHNMNNHFNGNYRQYMRFYQTKWHMMLDPTLPGQSASNKAFARKVAVRYGVLKAELIPVAPDFVIAAEYHTPEQLRYLASSRTRASTSAVRDSVVRPAEFSGAANSSGTVVQMPAPSRPSREFNASGGNDFFA